MITKDVLGRKIDRKYILVVFMCDGPVCDGIFETFEEAVGTMMCSIWEFSDSYKDEDDIFEYSELNTDGDVPFITVTFKDATWTKAEKETSYILTDDRLIKEETA